MSNKEDISYHIPEDMMAAKQEPDAMSDIEIYYSLLVWSFLLLYTHALTIKIIKFGSHELPLPAK
jgi:hypothetical protein